MTTNSSCTVYFKSLVRCIEESEKFIEGQVYSLDEYGDSYVNHTYVSRSEMGLCLKASQEISEGGIVAVCPFCLIDSDIEYVEIKTEFNQYYKITNDVHFVEFSYNFNYFCYVFDLINHSCDSNSWGYINIDSGNLIYELQARKKIHKDEEITLNYLSFEYDSEDNNFNYICGPKSCIKEYKGFKFLNKVEQNKLIESEDISENVLASLYIDASLDRRNEIEMLISNLPPVEQCFIYYLIHLKYMELD